MQCIICDSKKFSVIRKKIRFDIKRDVMRCDKCMYTFLRPLNKDELKYYTSKDYRKKYGPNLKKAAKSREIFNTYLPYQDEIVDEFRHILKPSFKVLDVGCSTGHFLTSLKGKVKQRVGIELNQQEVGFIRKNLDFKVYDEPVGTVEIEEGPFDLITSLEVIEHIEHPLEFLIDLKKHLKSDGYVYFELPNIADALITCYGIPGFIDFYYREPHLSYFSVDTFKKLVQKAGYVGEVKTVQRYNFLNHIHWMDTNKPQEDFKLGNGQPVLIKNNSSIRPQVKKELNAFIAKTDSEYRRILIKHGLGETLSFLGKKKK